MADLIPNFEADYKSLPRYLHRDFLEGRVGGLGYELVKQGKGWELRHRHNGEVIKRRVLDDIFVAFSLKLQKVQEYRKQAEARGMAFIPSIDVECPTCGAKPGVPCNRYSKYPCSTRQEEVPQRSRKMHIYLYGDEDDIYPLECPRCGIETIAATGDYVCVNCRPELDERAQIPDFA